MSSVFSRKITMSTFSGCFTGEGTPARQISGPVPSPSMKGMTGSLGTVSLPPDIVIVLPAMMTPLVKGTPDYEDYGRKLKPRGQCEGTCEAILAMLSGCTDYSVC